MKALYRRYRPINLSEVVGQTQVTTPLEAAIKEGKISHAYLFVGPRGTGKTSVARIFAHAVNGFNYELEDNYVDIIEIDGASNRGIDNIRDLKESVIICPTTGKYKIYIIDEVHMLTKDAFNALLKTLEEPPAHVIFILATTDYEKVPITITSRSQIFTFELARPEIMVPHLQAICGKEKIDITEDALSIIAERGGGSFRDTLSLLDQVSTLSDSQITAEVVEKVLGLPKDAKICELITASSSEAPDVVKITTLFQELLATGIKADTLTERIMAEIMKNPQPECLSLLSKLIEVKAPFLEAKLLVALTAKALEQSKGHSAVTTSPSAPEKTEQNRTPDSSQNTVVAPAAPRLVAPPSQTAPTTDFSWNDFLETVKNLNDSIFLQLSKCSYAIEGDTLALFPDKKIVRTILARDNNKKILIDALTNYQNAHPGFNVVKLTIKEVGETPVGVKKDPLISRISDIMGGEVTNDAGGNPF